MAAHKQGVFGSVTKIFKCSGEPVSKLPGTLAIAEREIIVAQRPFLGSFLVYFFELGGGGLAFKAAPVHFIEVVEDGQGQLLLCKWCDGLMGTQETGSDYSLYRDVAIRMEECLRLPVPGFVERRIYPSALYNIEPVVLRFAVAYEI
jgi:hypothetical protein